MFSKITLSLFLLTWRIWWAPNNASRWQMGFNSAFKGLIGTTKADWPIGLSPQSRNQQLYTLPPRSPDFVVERVKLVIPIWEVPTSAPRSVPLTEFLWFPSVTWQNGDSASNAAITSPFHKVKVTLIQALRLCKGRTAHRGSRDIALLFLVAITNRMQLSIGIYSSTVH